MLLKTQKWSIQVEPIACILCTGDNDPTKKENVQLARNGAIVLASSYNYSLQ
jgi:hypothetical protein